MSKLETQPIFSEVILKEEMSSMPDTKLEFNDIPLPEVPPLHQLNFSLELLNTAGHELNHILAAWQMGIIFESASVIKEGNSLGRTVFNGDINPETFQIIAAAGSVNPLFGSARGYAADNAQIALIDFMQGRRPGASRFFAVAKAEANINKVPLPVRMNAAKILAFLGEVSGENLGKILARAELEANLQKENKLHLLERVLVGRKISADQEKKETATGKYTVIDYYMDGSYGITRISNGVTIEKIIICSRCGGKNGQHHPDCKNNQSGLIFTREGQKDIKKDEDKPTV